MDLQMLTEREQKLFAELDYLYEFLRSKNLDAEALNYCMKR
jgi:hypothetical protein